MSAEGDPAFRFMRSQFRSGMLDALSPLLGLALDQAMAETGTDMEDLLMRLEALPEDAVEWMDRLAGRWAGPLLTLLAAEAPARLQARLLRSRPVRERVVAVLRRRMARFLSAPLPPPRRGGEG